LKTTLDILNATCLHQQIVKGGVNLNEKWLSETEIQNIIDEFPIEVFDPTTDEQDEALQEWFNKLKGIGCVQTVNQKEGRPE
jgi:hypothetical protein